MEGVRSKGALASVAKAVAEALERGVVLERSTLDFMESILGTLSPEDMARFLADEDSPEAQSVRELVFFPDRDMRERLESILEEAGLDRADEQALARLLAERLPRVKVIAPEGGTPDLALDERQAARLVARLKIWRHCPANLAAALEARFGPEGAVRTKAFLRQARFAYSDAVVAFLAGLAEAWSGDPDRLLGTVEVLHPLLDELGSDQDMYDFFMARKRTMAMHLRQGDFMDEARERNTFETLMSQGLRLPHVDREGFFRTMSAIDEVCLAVYGRTEYFGRPLADADRGRFDRDGGPGRFIEMFMEEP